MTVWGQCQAERQRQIIIFSLLVFQHFYLCTKSLEVNVKMLYNLDRVHKLHYTNCTAEMEAYCKENNDTYFSEQTSFIQVHVFSAARHESMLH